MAVGEQARVLIADDHAPTRDAVRLAVEAGGFLVCAEVADADGAIGAARVTHPDAALLDVRMPGDGLRAAEVIAREQPEVAVVMLTVSSDDDDLFAALAVGAAGYLVKGEDLAAIPGYLDRVLSGDAVVSDVLVKRLVEAVRERSLQRRAQARLPRGTRLTAREWEVLELLNRGLGTAEIARRLHVAEVTVRTHLAAINRKLQVPDRGGALRLIRGESP